MTADELFELDEPGWRHELVRGELVRREFLYARQSEVLGELMLSFANIRGGKALAATGYMLEHNPDTVRVAEVGFVQAGRVSRTAGYLEGAPDAAFNVIAPGEDVEEKTREWLGAGASAVVIIDADAESVRIYRHATTTAVNDVLEIEDVIPGWRLPLAELFA